MHNLLERSPDMGKSCQVQAGMGYFVHAARRIHERLKMPGLPRMYVDADWGRIELPPMLETA